MEQVGQCLHNVYFPLPSTFRAVVPQQYMHFVSNKMVFNLQGSTKDYGGEMPAVGCANTDGTSYAKRL